MTRTETIGVVIAVTLAGVSLLAQVEPPFPFRATDALASPRIAALRKDQVAGRTSAIEEFWEEMRVRGAPIVEPSGERHSFVTFVWRGSSVTKNVVIADGVAAGVGGVDPINSQMSRLDDTDVWYRTYEVRNDARFTYRISENDPMQSFIDPNRRSAAVVDPLNMRIHATGHSYVELSDAPPQTMATVRPIIPGKVVRADIRHSVLNTTWRVWIYTPPGYRASGARYPLLVVTDGVSHTTYVPVPTILDNLIAAKQIPPMVAIMVATSADRSSELGCSTAWGNFLARDIVPWMQSIYHATRNPRMTIVAGSSLGGLAATCAALHQPATFGNVLSQSGSYWWTPRSDPQPEWVTRYVADTPMVPVRFFMEVGTMEIPEQLETNRRLRDALRGRGYMVDYREFNGNHTYLNWRGSFGDGLVSLLRRAP